MSLLTATALTLAWGLDQAVGEPRNALHPVAWLGRVLAPLGRGLLRLQPAAAFVGGAIVWCAIATVLAFAGWQLQQWARGWWALPLLVFAIKPGFAWRMLRDEVAAVGAALAIGLPEARAQIGRLCSRDVQTLDADTVRETAIETLAENLNDSVVAPLFWFAVAGLPGAWVYRFANTADAMWGYRGRWEWAGKWAARADDVLSWLPARLTALLLRPPSWRALRGIAGVTPSPNGGWPMGAMALRLGVCLRKPGVYALNAGAPAPGAAHLDAALHAAGWAAQAAFVLALLVVVLQ